MVEIEIPDSVKILEFQESELPSGWDSLSNQPISQTIGDRFVEEDQFAVLKVLSVVVKGEYNFILNPKHKDFKKIEIIGTEPFPFDPRFFRR